VLIRGVWVAHLASSDAMRTVRLAAVAVLVSVCCSTAAAMPGDPPFTPLSPADGATATVDPDGIPVAFTCPAYRIADAGDGWITPGGPTDYTGLFSLSSGLGADGKLTDPVAYGRGAQPPGSAPDTCVSSLNAGGSVRPQETPGTYYWQVYRICLGCPGRLDEVGPVRRLTLVSNARPVLELPGKVYANYPFIASVSGDGLPNFSAVTVERARGGSWVKVGAASLAAGTAEVTVKLPKGGQRLRASVVIGGQTVTSQELAKTVIAAGKPKRATAGVYSGKIGPGTSSARFTVKGRTIRSFTAQVPMTCPGVTAGQFTTQIGTAKFGTIKLAPDGSFVGVKTSGSDTSMRVRGRLVKAKLTGGRIELSVGTCTGNISFQVKRS
jgi:hypothetical protein